MPRSREQEGRRIFWQEEPGVLEEQRWEERGFVKIWRIQHPF